jgi:hypothetical protein
MKYVVLECVHVSVLHYIILFIRLHSVFDQTLGKQQAPMDIGDDFIDRFIWLKLSNLKLKTA